MTFMSAGAHSGTSSAADADLTVKGDTVRGYVGSALQLLDLNGDGATDLAIGSRGDGDAAASAGSVEVFWGPPPTESP